jgi:hypothetical protein
MNGPTGDLRGVVDLDRYPIDRPGSAVWQALVERCRAELAADGACQLHGFLTSGAVEQTLAVAAPLRPLGWVTASTHNVFFTPLPQDDADSDDPRGMAQRSAERSLPFDLLPPELPLRRLYESDELTEFLRAALDETVLHRSADPLDCLQIAEFDPGDELGWHFDDSEYSITMMLRPSDGGGRFEYVPRMRSEGDPSEAAIVAVLRGDRSQVRGFATAPGTLALFRGHHALHRVTAVEGPRSRINAVLTYGPRPDMVLNALTQKLFYGRVVSRHAGPGGDAGVPTRPGGSA